MKKRFLILLCLFSVGSHAQTFMCGSNACTNAQIIGNAIYSGPGISGIDDLVVDGQLWNMTISNTMNSPFNAAQGIDAANAIGALFGKLPGFIDNAPGLQFGNAIATASFMENGSLHLDSVPIWPSQTTFGADIEAVPYAPCNGETGACTTWVKAPELDGANWAGALTLLAGMFAVLRGRMKRGKGTADMVRRAKAAGVEVLEVRGKSIPDKGETPQVQPEL